MICRLTGRVAVVNEQTAAVEVGPLCYELLVPAASVPDLQRLIGNEMTFHTIQYLDGNPTIGNMIPRLVGFLTETDRDFFQQFVKVKNVGARKALRAMSLPVPQMAAAIERGDERFLSDLPEIGKRTAAQIIVQLRGQLQRFAAAEAASFVPVSELSEAQQVALEILVGWGERRPEAQSWVLKVRDKNPKLEKAEDIVRAIYRLKQGLSA